MVETKKRYDSQNISKNEIIRVITRITDKEIIGDPTKRDLVKQLKELPAEAVLRFFNEKQLWYLERSLKRKDLLPVYLTKEEILRLIGSAIRYQDKLMIKFAVHTGCRLNELITVEAQNVNISGRAVRVRGKGSKDRAIHIADPAFIEELAQFIRNKDHSEPIFLSNQNRKFKHRGLQRKIKRIARRAGLNPEKISWHKCRHAYAVFAIESGVPIPILAKQMGHSDPATTMIYTRISDQQVKKTFEDANPTQLEEKEPEKDAAPLTKEQLQQVQDMLNKLLG
ncbi:tyrosine-type recombinase/integrase [Planctomycetota bacterium]